MPKNRTQETKKTTHSPVEAAIEAIGGKWKVLVNHPRALTRQLDEMERCGVIERFVHQQILPIVESSRIRRDLKPMRMAMHAWGEQLENLITKNRR